MRGKPDVTASLWSCPLGKQFGAGRGELHVCPGLLQPEPARCNRALDAGAVLIRRAAGLEECAVDQLDIGAAVLHRLDGIGDLHQLACGSGGIIEGGWARRTSCGFHAGDMDVLAHALDVDHCAAEASGLAAR
jgi:hypothetical protein